MAASLTITPGGGLELAGRPYLIPDEFSSRKAHSYRRLLEPIPDVPGGTTLSRAQRRRQEAYLLRRAAACVVPGLQTADLESVDEREIRALHDWISENRPELAGEGDSGALA